MATTLIDNDNSKLGIALMERLSNTRSGSERISSRCSDENYTHMLWHVNDLLNVLRCTETVENGVFSYSYKDSVFFRADLQANNVEFPVYSQMMAQLKKDAAAKDGLVNDPLFGFALGFVSVDRYIYGPAQGMYNMFFAFDKGYMVSHYPESRGWFKI
jgi:hypothetical protein